MRTSDSIKELKWADTKQISEIYFASAHHLCL